MKKKSIIWSVILVLIASIIIYFQAWQYIQPSKIKPFIESFGVWTPIVYCLIYLVVVFIPHAGTAMTIVGGLIFNPLFGTAIVITISTLGSILPFLIAKKHGRKRIKAKIEKTRFKKYLDKTDENSFMFALYMRLIPLIPYELQNYILGLIDISVGRFILATFIGLLPGTFMLIYLGNTITDISIGKLIILGITSLIALLIPWILKKYTKAKEVLDIKEKEEKEN